jgi:Prophage protein (DUF1660)
MKKLLCWLFGHDRMVSNRNRVCQRCGAREILKRFGQVLAWEEVPEIRARSSRV